MKHNLINSKHTYYTNNYLGSVSVCLVFVAQQAGLSHISLVMRKPFFCICENKDADQLRGKREADQRLCFRYTDSTIPLLPKSEISSLYLRWLYSPVFVGSGWKPRRPVFSHKLISAWKPQRQVFFYDDKNHTFTMRLILFADHSCSTR